ncbi:hypothetical protein BOX15_Mlig015705g1, partial [Macrostomum lignano]
VASLVHISGNPATPRLSSGMLMRCSPSLPRAVREPQTGTVCVTSSAGAGRTSPAASAAAEAKAKERRGSGPVRVGLRLCHRAEEDCPGAAHARLVRLSGAAGSGVNIAYDNAGFQPTTLELRATSSEPQYRRSTEARGLRLQRTTTTKTTTVVQSQQEQEQQQVADSWV